MAKTLVVLGGHYHVAHAGFTGDFGPFAGGEWLGLELLGERSIFRNRNALVFHDPLVAADNAVESPVDEHAKASLVPPLHPALTVGFTGRRGNRSLRRSRRLLETKRRTHGKRRRCQNGAASDHPITPRRLALCHRSMPPLVNCCLFPSPRTAARVTPSRRTRRVHWQPRKRTSTRIATGEAEQQGW